MPNPNDLPRRHILQWFYDRNSNATSQRGKNGSAVKISDAKKGLKQDYSLSQAQVMSNLTYLIDKGWINKTEIEKTVPTKTGTTVPSTVVWYEISSSGIDKIEGESEFQEGGKYAGININATGTNVITTGDGNIVNVVYEDLHSSLDQLKAEIGKSTLDDTAKLDVAVDIETLKDQLVKSEPDATIANHLWNRISEIAVVGGFADTVAKITPMIAAIGG